MFVLAPLRARADGAPNLVFVLLDATRADRFGAWGNPNQTTPWLDGLARGGVAFLRHFANAHATRASIPQLMTGRYYQQSILRPFMPDAHPREFSFARSDPSAVLLPAILRARGYRAVGVSAHPWVVAESEFGRQFDQLDFIAADPSRGHADGAAVVDRALELWHTRDPERPLLLYVHLMDMHMPRFLPENEPRYPVPGFDWRQRFEPGGEPIFNRDARRWALNDARAFTELDRRHFAAVYDTRLNYADALLGRLLAALRSGDPELRRTLVVVVADHGEELGENGRTDHLDSLADAVQHIPWIVSGGPVRPGQHVERFTENVDVLPTVLAVLGVPLPAGARIDGRAQLASDGAVCEACGKAAVYYVYEDYQAIRTGRYLLRVRSPESFKARCAGAEELLRLGRYPIRLDAAGRYRRVAARLERRLARRVGPRARAYLAVRFGTPTGSFTVRPAYWVLAPAARVACVPVDLNTSRWALRTPGWMWSGRGVTVLRRDADRPLPVTVRVPDGTYRVEAAAVPMEPMPWLFGLRRWRSRSFLPDEPRAFVPLGTFHASAGALAVAIPVQAGVHNHIVGLRLSPPETAPASGPTQEDPQLRERLRALGYVQ